MPPEKNIFINESAIDEEVSFIPHEDFINGQFDLSEENRLTNLLVILSTPRSGSTFLSDLLDKNNICLPHEYFQPAQYLPMLAKRWHCIENGKLNKQLYVKNLVRFRTSPSGWLGINVHGHHLPFFEQCLQWMPVVDVHYVHITRKDVVAQAVSYEIASQTKRWSSHFSAENKPQYSYSDILNKLHRIQHLNATILTHAYTREINLTSISYEELVAHPQTTLESIISMDAKRSLNTESALKKQANSTNSEWLQKFSSDYLKYNGKPRSWAKIHSIKKHIQPALSRIED